jgi:hypothetical protein
MTALAALEKMFCALDGSLLSGLKGMASSSSGTCSMRRQSSVSNWGHECLRRRRGRKQSQSHCQHSCEIVARAEQTKILVGISWMVLLGFSHLQPLLPLPPLHPSSVCPSLDWTNRLDCSSTRSQMLGGCCHGTASACRDSCPTGRDVDTGASSGQGQRR